MTDKPKSSLILPGTLSGRWARVALPLVLFAGSGACNTDMLPFGGSRHTDDPMQRRAAPTAASQVAPRAMDPELIARMNRDIRNDPDARGRVIVENPLRYQYAGAVNLVADTVADLKALDAPADGDRAGRDMAADILGQIVAADLASVGRPAGNPGAQAAAWFQIDNFIMKAGGRAHATGAGLKDGVCAAYPALGPQPLGDMLTGLITLIPSGVQDLNDADGDGAWTEHEGEHCFFLHNDPLPGETPTMTALRLEVAADEGMKLKRICNGEADMERKMKAYAMGRDLSEVIFTDDLNRHRTGPAIQAMLDAYLTDRNFKDRCAGKTASQLTEAAYQDFVLPSLKKEFSYTFADFEANKAQEARIMQATQYMHDVLYKPDTLPPDLTEVNEVVAEHMLRVDAALKNYAALAATSGVTWAIDTRVEPQNQTAFAAARKARSSGLQK